MAFSASRRRNWILSATFEANLKKQSALLSYLFFCSIRDRHMILNANGG
jgi:hypothetical protein